MSEQLSLIEISALEDYERIIAEGMMSTPVEGLEGLRRREHAEYDLDEGLQVWRQMTA